MKRILCIVLVLAVAYAVPITVSAAAFDRKDFGMSSNFNFHFQDGTLDFSMIEDISSPITSTCDEMYVIIGDKNVDGKVNVKDATSIQKKLASSTFITAREIRIADSNDDGKLNIRDATAIQKYVAKMLTDTKIGTRVCLTETVRVFLNPWKEGLDTEKYWSTPDEVYLVYWFNNEEFDRIAEHSWPGVPVKYCEEIAMYVAEIPVYAEQFAFLNKRSDTGVQMVPNESDKVLQVTSINFGY